MPRHRFRQDGVALVVGLIMLVLLTLMVLSAINSGTVNLRISGNMQAEDEARAAAQQAIENFLSSYANFCTNAPPAACTVPSPAGKPPTGYDVNNTATPTEYTVTVAPPVCKRAAPQVPGHTAACINGAKAGLFCWDTLWEVQATAVDAKTGVSQVVTQGVAVPFPPGFTPSAVGC